MFVLLRHLRAVRRQAALARDRRPRSVALRHVDCGSCNACEHELGATLGPAYDMRRYGLDVVASPRHADALVITGPITRRMEPHLREAYAAMPEPRLVVALGDCARGAGVLADPKELAPPLAEILGAVDIEVPGCPPSPERIAAAILDHLEATAGGDAPA